MHELPVEDIRRYKGHTAVGEDGARIGFEEIMEDAVESHPEGNKEATVGKDTRLHRGG